jgi:ABC-type transport system involved in multi-copper enzyme maturation permease subunit
MQATQTVSILEFFSPWRLLGPLSDRELRITSRRVRSYALRSGYILLLCALMLSAWYAIVGAPKGSVMAFGASRASVVSAYVASRIITFQFAAAQMIAALMLSSSIADEMRRGTLGVLLTTPITSAHIVAGKLLSGLLQTVLLLAISLPALAALRLLGGLSWDSVLAGFCITLTAAVFAGTLSLLLSTYYRHPFQAVSASAVVYLVLFAGLPFVTACLSAVGVLSPRLVEPVLNLASPFRALSRTLPWMGQARAGGTIPFFSWPLHCLIVVGVTAVLAGVSVWRIRRVAAGLFLRSRDFRPVQRLRGSPVAWKEDPGGHLLWRRSNLLVAAAVLLLCLPVLTTPAARNAPLGMYLYYGFGGLWLVAVLRLAISAAGGITREKESGAWQVLLTTPLNDGQILWGKAVAALRGNAMLLAALLTAQFCLILRNALPGQGLAAVLYTLFRLAALGFVLGAGLYFGTRLKTTTAAVVATVAAFLCVNYLLGGTYNPLVGWLWRTIASNTGRWGNNNVMLLHTVATMGAAFLLDVGLGVYLLGRARRNVRANVF